MCEFSNQQLIHMLDHAKLSNTEIEELHEVDHELIQVADRANAIEASKLDAYLSAAHGAVRTARASRFLVGGPPLTDLTQYVDLIDSLLGPDDDPKSAFHDLKKIEGLRFDGSKCATCPRNCCIVHDPDEQYIAIREDELATIYAAYPECRQSSRKQKRQRWPPLLHRQQERRALRISRR